MNLTWYTAGTDNPMDEQADLMAGYWAIIGPEAGGRFDWTVVAPDGADIAGGNADSAEAAKVAVVEWFRQSVYYSVGRTDTPPPGLVRTPPKYRPHVATYAADGDGYLVTCPEGCKLGTSEHQLTEAGALRRIELHKISTTRLLP